MGLVTEAETIAADVKDVVDAADPVAELLTLLHLDGHQQTLDTIVEWAARHFGYTPPAAPAPAEPAPPAA